MDDKEKQNRNKMLNADVLNKSLDDCISENARKTLDCVEEKVVKKSEKERIGRHRFLNHIKAKQRKGEILIPLERLMFEKQRIVVLREKERRIVVNIDGKYFLYRNKLDYREVLNEKKEVPLFFGCSSAKKRESGKEGKPSNIEGYNKAYYKNRYYLFSKYDHGVQLDNESWYSVTPEELAIHIARKCSQKVKVILDPFCGAGGNTIQFAKVCDKVYANDLDFNKTQMAYHNSIIYRTDHKIQFLNEDFLNLNATHFSEPIDAIFLSPPWGGVSYGKDDRIYDLSFITPQIDLIIQKALSISKNIILYMPRNTDINQLANLFLNYSSFFEDSSEVHLQIKHLDFYERIKYFLVGDLDQYQTILIKNIMKLLGLGKCYELAKKTEGLNCIGTEYISILKDHLTEDEWNLAKKMHKMQNKCVNKKKKTEIRNDDGDLISCENEVIVDEPQALKKKKRKRRKKQKKQLEVVEEDLEDEVSILGKRERAEESLNAQIDD